MKKNRNKMARKEPVLMNNLIWAANLFFLVACLAALTQFLAITFVPGLVIGLAVASFLYYRNRTEKNAIGASLVVNFIVLYATVIIVSYFLWNNLLREGELAITKYIVVLFFLLGLGAIGLLLRLLWIDNKSSNTKLHVKDIMSGPSLLISFCVAAVLTDLNLIVFSIINEGTQLAFLREKFLERGLIPPLCLILFYWEAILLLGKYYISRKSLVTTSDNQLIALWKEYKKAQKAKLSQDILVRKFVDMAWQANESFYFFPRYINWAIPILGFIGTVLGISLAAGEIGNLVGSNSVNIGDSINAAMQPLGIAFDTTLIALSLSIFLAFMYTLLQRWEEQRFLFLEDYIAAIK